MAGLRWTVPPQTAWPALAANYRQAIERGVHAIAQRWAPEIENYMKSNAPWTDRTGNARGALYSKVEPPTPAQIRGMIEIWLGHGMDYGIFLELRNAGRYAIVNPALDYFAPRIWADVRRMLS